MASLCSVLVYPAIFANKVRYSIHLLNPSFAVCICDSFEDEDVKKIGIKSQKG